MHEIDLKEYDIRTDLLIETVDLTKENKGIKNTTIKYDNITVEQTTVSIDALKLTSKRPGIYKTITFEDVTDKDNYQKVLEVFTKYLKILLEENNIKNTDTCLIIGLGNRLSTPDALGSKVLDNVLVTKHLFSLGEIEQGYRNVSIFLPGVTGNTGIETTTLISGIVDKVKPDFLIIIDALASTSLDRLNKTIQMSNTGIAPGSGVGNNREEINKEKLNIPVIAIGVPTIVDAATIVSDTIKYLYKQFSYKIQNVNNAKLKLIDNSRQNYLNYDKELSAEQKIKVLGMVGGLSEEDTKQLIYEVLSPINYNLMVTPKEIDFVIEKLSMLIGKGINMALHEKYESKIN